MRPLARLLAMMARLRDPASAVRGMVEQTFATIAPYTIEEAYEVAEAIDSRRHADLRDELGDLLFQVVFHARMAEERRLRVRRCGRGDRRQDGAPPSACLRQCQNRIESGAKARPGRHTKRPSVGTAPKRAGAAESVLDGVALALPALLRADKIQKRAARIGFDWPDARPVFDKLKEEIAELESELQKPAARRALEDEMGDILFTAANLARKLDIDPKAALRRATAKFERRFRRVETLAAEHAAGSDLDSLEALWQQVKREEHRVVGRIRFEHEGRMRFRCR